MNTLRTFSFTNELGDSVIRSYFSPPVFGNGSPDLVVSSLMPSPLDRPTVLVIFVREWVTAANVEEGAMPFGTVHRWQGRDPDLNEPIPRVAVAGYRCSLCRTLFIVPNVRDLEHWCAIGVREAARLRAQGKLISTGWPV